MISAPLTFELQTEDDELLNLALFPQKPDLGVRRFKIPVSGTLNHQGKTSSIQGYFEAKFSPTLPLWIGQGYLPSADVWKLEAELNLESITLKTSKSFRRNDLKMMLDGEMLLDGKSVKVETFISGADVKQAIPIEKLFSKLFS